MLAEMSWEQFKSWLDYASLEPFSEDRADYRSAQITAMIAEVNRDPKKRPRPYSPLDFMLDFGDKKQAGKRGPQPLTDPEEFRRLTVSVMEGIEGSEVIEG